MLNNGQSRHDGAAGEARRAITLDATDSGAWRELGRAHLGLGKTDEARQAFLKAVELGPSDWAAHNHLGGFYFGVNQLDQAATSFQRVIDLAPDNIRGYNNLGSVSLRLERLDRAVEMYERSLSLEKNATAFANLGLAYYEQGQFADAARSYEGAVALPRPTFQLWSNLGAACYWAPGLRARAKTAYETAVTLGQQALDVTPKNAAVLSGLADVHAVLTTLSTPPASVEHAKEARRLLATVANLQPQASDVLFTIGGALEQLGDRAAALDWLARAVKAGYPLKSIQRSPFLTALRQDPRFLKQFPQAP
jgi:tetratricopeptide (TPR) repeat protein